MWHCYFFALLGGTSLLHCSYMTTDDKVKSLIQQATELPEEAQAELVQSLVEMRAEHLEIYSRDDDERAGLADGA